MWSCGPILLPSLTDLNEKVEEDQEAEKIDYDELSIGDDDDDDDNDYICSVVFH